MYSEWKCWKNILVFCNSFCKACCAFKSCMNKACWKSCCRQQIQTITLLTRGYKFQHRNLHQSVEILPIMQEVLLSEFFAGKGNFSEALLMQLLNAKNLCRRVSKTQNVFLANCGSNCCVEAVHVFWMKMLKKHFGVLQLFLQSLLCLQKLHEQSLLKILLPATNSNNNTSYKRVQISTQKSPPKCWNFAHPARSVIVWIFCW